jgi:hypothetical protein
VPLLSVCCPIDVDALIDGFAKNIGKRMMQIVDPIKMHEALSPNMICQNQKIVLNECRVCKTNKFGKRQNSRKQALRKACQFSLTKKKDLSDI